MSDLEDLCMKAFKAGWYWGYMEGLFDTMSKTQRRRKGRSMTNEQLLQYLEGCFRKSRAISVYNKVVTSDKQEQLTS